MFGVKRNYPEAIRWGEKFMIEGGQKMPEDVGMAVRNYMLKNSESYYAKDVMRNSGPINNSALYHADNKNSASALFCMDDPYWQEYKKAHTKREDVYKTPSIFAWNHKQDGLMGELFDMEEIRRKDEELSRYNMERSF